MRLPVPASPVAAVLGLLVVAAAGAPRAEGPAAAGPEVWVARYDGGSYDVAVDLAVGPDGHRVFVTGYSFGEGVERFEDYATIAYDAENGATLWVERYDGLGHGFDVAHAVAVSPDGSLVFVTGESGEDASFPDYVTIAYDAATGQRVWLRTFDGPGLSADRAYAIAVSPDGRRVFVTGEGPTSQRMTLAYAAATGAELWITPTDEERGEAVAVAPDGHRVYVTGGDRYQTTAFNAATGRPIWSASQTRTGFNGATGLAVTPDNSRVIVAGDLHGGGDEYIDPDYLTVAYEARSGIQLGEARHDGPQENDWDLGTGIAVSPDGRTAFVTGGEGPIAPKDYATVAYDVASGTELWLARYDGPDGRDDVAGAVTVTPDGQYVLVTGYSRTNQTGWDYATVAYLASTGSRIGVARYDGPAEVEDFDRPYAVGVSPDGSRVFVTGESAGGSSAKDFLTIAYGRATLTG